MTATGVGAAVPDDVVVVVEDARPTGGGPAKPRVPWLGLLLVAGLALALRLGFAFGFAEDPKGDALYFHGVAHNLAEGRGYRYAEPIGGPEVAEAALRETAQHPPAIVLTLAALERVGLGSVDAQRAALAVIASAGVLLVGLLGHRLGGSRARQLAIVAAVIAAVHPIWIQYPGQLFSESLYLVAVPGALLLAVAALDRPTAGRFVGLGAALGAVALIRSEGVLPLLLGVPVALVAGRGWRRRIGGLALVGAACALVMAPWVVRNLVQFDTPTIAFNRGNTLAGSYCDETFAGDRLGGFSLPCVFGYASFLPDQDYVGDVASSDRRLTEWAQEYARDHLGEMPKVVAARVGRTWGVLFPGDVYDFDVAEGRDAELQQLGRILHWVLLPLALAGAVLLPRRCWRRWWVVATPVAMVTLVVAVIYGSTRMRTGAEPSIALFAAVALVRVGAALPRRGTRGREPRSRRDDDAVVYQPLPNARPWPPPPRDA